MPRLLADGLDGRRALRTAALFCVGAAVVAIAWVRLFEEHPSIVSVLEMVGIAAIPTLAALVLRGRLLLAVWPVPVALGTLLAAAGAFHVSLLEMRPGPEHDFFGPVAEAVRIGMRDTFDAQVPVDAIAHPEIESLALLAIFGFTALVGMLVAVRRLVPAGAVLIGAVAWPSTPIAAAGGNSLGVGAVLLAAVLLLLLAASGERRRVRAVPQAIALALVAGLAAVGASTSSAVAKEAVVDFRGWNPYEQARAQVGVRYVWSTSYAPLSWPDEPTVVLRVKAPDRALYWRATTLDEYTGVGWREALDPARQAVEPRLDAPSDPLLPRVARRDRSQWTRQDVTVGALADDHLIGAASPVRWQLGPGVLTQTTRSGVVLVPDGLERGGTYTVWSYTPEADPKSLVELPADYPRAAERYLELVPGLAAPAFGVEGRDRALTRLLARSDDPLVRDLRRLYDRAQEVVSGAPSPYVTAVSLEQWFRSGNGGFTYDESPPQPDGSGAPLVDFVLETQAGYCQHYAGAMVLMLRMLGIPSRVAAGFIQGEYDEKTGEWVVVDRDAHTWVEVWFPGYGWLPFDPTPGRGRLAEPYSAASPGFSLTEEEQGGGVDVASIFAQQDKLAEIFKDQLGAFQSAGSAQPAPAAGETAPAEAPAAAPAGGGGIDWLPILVALGVVGSVGLFLGAKELRRRLRYRDPDPRAQAAACRRDLTGFLADQGVDLPASETLEELGERLRRAYTVEPSRFVRAASAARFAPPAAAAEAARTARRELGELRRLIRRELGVQHRLAGAFRLRSLTR